MDKAPGHVWGMIGARAAGRARRPPQGERWRDESRGRGPCGPLPPVVSAEAAASAATLSSDAATAGRARAGWPKSVAAIEEMTRAPSSGVKCSFSTALRTSLTRRSATCHFGSIVAPNSVGFIDANWCTSEVLTVPAMTSTPSYGRKRLHAFCRAQPPDAPIIFANCELPVATFSTNLRGLFPHRVQPR